MCFNRLAHHFAGRLGIARLLHEVRLPLLGLLVFALPATVRAQECLYVLNQQSGTTNLVYTVTIIEPTSGRVVDTVPITECMPPQCQLTSLTLNDDATRAYVTQLSPGLLYVVDLADEDVLDAEPVGAGASAAALTTDGSTVFVANLGGDSVSVYDTATSAVVDTIPVGDGPRALAVTPNGEQLLVANRGPVGNPGQDSVSVIQVGGAVIDSITVGDQPAGVAVTADGAVAYVSNGGADTVTPIDLTTLTPGNPIPVGDSPRGIVFSPDGATAFVANVMPSVPGTVSVIDRASGNPGEPITVGNGPVALALSSDGGTLYVANLSDDMISVIDVATREVDAIPAGDSPFDLTVRQCPPGTVDTPTPQPTATAEPSPTPTTVIACTGDCGGNGVVDINELILGVNIVLGNRDVTACPVFDRNGDGVVVIADLIAAVGIAQTMCPT
jgi:YVTN family beta-propeller protein